MNDKSEELHHWQRKCDTNDKEVRSLRLRIGELVLRFPPSELLS